MATKYKYTAMRKYRGDAAYSWAVFLKKSVGGPVYAGLGLYEARSIRNRLEKEQAEKYEPKKGQ